MERRVAVHRCVRTAMHPPAGNTSVSTMDQKHVFYSALKHKMLCREARRVARCQTLSLGRGVVVSPRRLVRCRTHSDTVPRNKVWHTTDFLLRRRSGALEAMQRSRIAPCVPKTL